MALVDAGVDHLAESLTAFTVSHAYMDMMLPLLPLSACALAEADEEYRRIRREEWLAQVDEVMELRKQRRLWSKVHRQKK